MNYIHICLSSPTIPCLFSDVGVGLPEQHRYVHCEHQQWSGIHAPGAEAHIHQEGWGSLDEGAGPYYH